MSNINFTFSHKTIREKKGCSLIDFPQNYTVVDLETTGFSPEWDSIIEIAGIKVRDNVIVDTFTSLLNTPEGIYVDDHITALTGITQEMVDEAPLITSVLPDFLKFIGDDFVIGHNANFDVNFLYDKSNLYLNVDFCNDFVDTMRLFRRLMPDKPHHRLSDLAAEFKIDHSGAHRSLNDCAITYQGYLSLQHLAIKIHGSTDSFNSFLKKKRNSRTHPSLKASDIHTCNTEFDTSHPLYGKVCVFTGALDKMLRKEAMQIVVDLGGINGDNVTKKTNYLILGNNAYCKTIKDGKSSKQKKAEKLKLAGQDIEIIPEDVFYDMIFE